MTKVNILGTEYEIKKVKEHENFEILGADGFCDFTTKEIYIHEIEREPGMVFDLEEYYKKLIRHEIVHAALYESGLDSSSLEHHGWACNEEMVDWIAIQAPKLFKMFKEANAL